VCCASTTSRPPASRRPGMPAAVAAAPRNTKTGSARCRPRVANPDRIKLLRSVPPRHARACSF
jgi:hypothetical protein